jgi:hypothetical protein
MDVDGADSETAVENGVTKNDVEKTNGVNHPSPKAADAMAVDEPVASSS